MTIGGIVGTSPETEQWISLDDVSLIQGPCPSDLACTFDEVNQNCYWENYDTPDSNIAWIIGSGDTEDPSYHPRYYFLEDETRF